MKALICAALCLVALSGCAVLEAAGFGPKDLAPSLRYCEQVQYVRTGQKAQIYAECNIPAGL